MAGSFAAAAEKFGKTAAAIINLSETDMRDIFQEKHIPVFDAATDACFKMLRGYIDYGRFSNERTLRRQAVTRSSTERWGSGAILKAHPGTVTMLPHAATVALLGQYGFQCADYRLASNYDRSAG